MELITILTMIKGIEFLFTTIRIGSKYYTYLEISRKIELFEDAKSIYDFT